MRSPDQPGRDAGFLVSTLLLVLLCAGVILAVSWYQHWLAEKDLLREQLLVRLERELPGEIDRLYARARAAGSPPDRQLIEAQAFVNLHTRGRREMVALENERQRVKQLVRDRVDAREELSRLSLEVRRAKMWVMMLEQRLKTMPRVHKGAAASAPGRRASP